MVLVEGQLSTFNWFDIGVMASKNPSFPASSEHVSLALGSLAQGLSSITVSGKVLISSSSSELIEMTKSLSLSAAEYLLTGIFSCYYKAKELLILCLKFQWCLLNVALMPQAPFILLVG